MELNDLQKLNRKELYRLAKISKPKKSKARISKYKKSQLIEFIKSNDPEGEKVKKYGKSPEKKVPEADKKPKCGIKEPAKNERKGTMSECAQKKQIRLYGINKVDKKIVQKTFKKPVTVNDIAKEMAPLRGKKNRLQRELKSGNPIDVAKREERKEELKEVKAKLKNLSAKAKELGGNIERFNKDHIDLFRDLSARVDMLESKINKMKASGYREIDHIDKRERAKEIDYLKAVETQKPSDYDINNTDIIKQAGATEKAIAELQADAMNEPNGVIREGMLQAVEILEKELAISKNIIGVM